MTSMLFITVATLFFICNSKAVGFGGDDSCLKKFVENGTVLEVACVARSRWNFSDFRLWSLKQNQSAIHLNISCDGGTLVLSHPLQAGNLTQLRVTNCVKIEGMFANFSELDPSPTVAYTTLKVLEITNSSYLYNETSILQQAENFQTMYGCVTVFPRGLRVLKQSKTKFEGDFEGFQILADGNICNYDSLEVYEKSVFWSKFGSASEDSENEIFYFLRSGNFKNLRIANFSNSNLKFIPSHFTEYNWSRRFKSIEIIDLSYNRIKEVPYLRRPHHWGVKMILQHNEISRITTTLLDKLRQVYIMLVDISQNEFSCTCESELDTILRFVKNQLEEPWASPYGYLANEVCSSPPKLRGISLKSLNSMLLCPDKSVEYPKISFIILIVLTSVAIICIVIKFRKEIKILTYTRLGLRLWRMRRNDVLLSKEYDAFVSYSTLDESWVLGTLCKRLEEHRPPLRLCLHHKHFILGACISDNIIESVERSRHTIIVLSENFLQSEWCLLEFRKAFHQTLLERTRHLIVVLMSNINMDTVEPEMKHFLRTHTYLKRHDFLFWDRLIYAVSDTESQMSERKTPSAGQEETVDNMEDIPLKSKDLDL